MTVRATLLLSITACCIACADTESPRESDGGHMQPQVDQPDAADEHPMPPPKDPEDAEAPKDDGGAPATMDPDSGAPVVLPPADPCEGAAEGFACNGYGFSVTPIVGNGEIQLGNGYADDTYERFVPEKLVRKECVQVDESMVTRGWSRAISLTSGTNMEPKRVSGQLSVVAFREPPPELVSYAEHARESATVSTFAYAETQQGPHQMFLLAEGAPKSPEGCGTAFVWSIPTSAAVGVIVELTFPSATSRDAFTASVGVNGVREGMTGSAESSARVFAAAAHTGAYVTLHVASSPGIADEMNALLTSSACSVLDFASCRETYDSVRALFASHLAQEDPKIWETAKPVLRRFDEP